jgi:ferritin-like metal-binding protein YciE
MERTVIKIPQSNIEEARDQRAQAAFRQHLAETEGHVRNLEEVFRLMGWALCRDDVVNLLQRNLGSEQHTLQEVRTLQEQIAATLPSQGAGQDQGVMERVKSAVRG